MSSHISNVRPKADKVLVDIVDYVTKYKIKSKDAYETARYCLMDTLGCGFEALEYPACTKLLGPIVQGTVVPNGARVPGTQFQLDPVKAAFDIGAMIRWLDFNDTWLAAEWGHPSDNLGGILATADWLSRNAVASGRAPLTVNDVQPGRFGINIIRHTAEQTTLGAMDAGRRLNMEVDMLARYVERQLTARFKG